MGYTPTPTPTPWHSTSTFIIFLLTTTAATTTPITQPLPPPPQPPPPPPPHNYALKPSMTIIVGALTTVFSITFLLLLYAKHCRRSHHHHPPESNLSTVRSLTRDNSGIDRTIIESLPVFRFGALSGHTKGLECAVCLSPFNTTEVLRLLPKCKHAFHVECVDTWLDSHSTCPLCRYRVDPEDIFLISTEHEASRGFEIEEEKELAIRRVSGRHSSAGEKRLQISVDMSPALPPAADRRRSLDSWNGKRSLKKTKRKEDRRRKDELLLPSPAEAVAVTVAEEERGRGRGRGRGRRQRLEHRIVVGPGGGGERWSDVQPSDLLYLRSEMIVSDVRRLKRSRPSVLHEGNNGWWQSGSGRGVINSRSVSELTGLSRFGSSEEAGVVSRLLARLSEPRSGRDSGSAPSNV